MPTIMICDDERSSVQPLIDLLKYEGFEVAESTNAQQCLSMSESISYDGFVVDMDLEPTQPGELWHGLHLAKVLADRSTPVCAPIIGITGHTTSKIEVQANEIGFVNFLKKPFDPEIVLNDLKNLLKPDEKSLELSFEVIEKQYAVLHDLISRADQGEELDEDIAHALSRLRELQMNQADVMTTASHANRALKPGQGWKALKEAEEILKNANSNSTTDHQATDSADPAAS